MHRDYRTNWHHRLIAEELEQLHFGRSVHLIITTPPRRGKSELVSRMFPAWQFAMDPNRELLLAAHSQSLADAMSRDVQRVMKSGLYTAAFGHLMQGRQTQSQFDVGDHGGFRAVGIGVGLAGYGANVGLIDDYFRHRADAESDTEREKLWEWYLDDFSTRMMSPFCQVVMATRWHHDDLIGRLLAEPDAAKWRVIHLPEINDWDEEEQPDYDPREHGEPLWPGFFEGYEDPVQAAHDAFQAQMQRNPYGTEALYQGRPTPRGGGLFRREWLQHYTTSPDRAAGMCEQLMITVDASFKATKNSDYVSIQLVGKKGGAYYLIDEHYERMDYPRTKSVLLRWHERYPRAGMLIEDKANGSALISDLKRAIPRVLPFEPGKHGSKEARAQIAAQAFAAGNVWLPSPHYAPWVSDYTEDFCGFGSRPHDDRVDALSQLIIHWSQRSSPLEHLRRIVGSSPFAGPQNGASGFMPWQR